MDKYKCDLYKYLDENTRFGLFIKGNQDRVDWNQMLLDRKIPYKYLKTYKKRFSDSAIQKYFTEKGTIHGKDYIEILNLFKDNLTWNDSLLSRVDEQVFFLKDFKKYTKDITVDNIPTRFNWNLKTLEYLFFDKKKDKKIIIQKILDRKLVVRTTEQTTNIDYMYTLEYFTNCVKNKNASTELFSRLYEFKVPDIILLVRTFKEDDYFIKQLQDIFSPPTWYYDDARTLLIFDELGKNGRKRFFSDYGFIDGIVARYKLERLIKTFRKEQRPWKK